MFLKQVMVLQNFPTQPAKRPSQRAESAKDATFVKAYPSSLK